MRCKTIQEEETRNFVADRNRFCKKVNNFERRRTQLYHFSNLTSNQGLSAPQPLSVLSAEQRQS